MMKNIVILRTDWLYSGGLDEYQHIFDVIPREAFLHFILGAEDTPSTDACIEEYFCVMYYRKYNTTSGVERYFLDIDDLVERIYSTIDSIIDPYLFYYTYRLVGWRNPSTIVLTIDGYTPGPSLAAKLSTEKFVNYPEIYEAIKVISELNAWIRKLNL